MSRLSRKFPVFSGDLGPCVDPLAKGVVIVGLRWHHGTRGLEPSHDQLIDAETMAGHPGHGAMQGSCNTRAMVAMVQSCELPWLPWLRVAKGMTCAQLPKYNCNSGRSLTMSCRSGHHVFSIEELSPDLLEVESIGGKVPEHLRKQGYRWHLGRNACICLQVERPPTKGWWMSNQKLGSGCIWRGRSLACLIPRCKTCEIIRPPRAAHCKDCDHCVPWHMCGGGSPSMIGSVFFLSVKANQRGGALFTYDHGCC